MANNGDSITLSATQPAPSGHASVTATDKTLGGKSLSSKVTTAPAAAAPKPAAPAAVSGSGTNAASANSASDAAAVAKTTPPILQPDLQTLVTQLNKHLNDSGQPDQFRVDPHSNTMIQQVNPATGAVIGEFAASEFPALARSAGASGLLVDSLA
jgi:hypothetical protein